MFTPSLDPCKHCGGSAVFDHDDDAYHWIYCTKCFICTDTRQHGETSALVELARTWNNTNFPKNGARSPQILYEDLATGNKYTKAARCGEVAVIWIGRKPWYLLADQRRFSSDWCLVPKELTAANGAKKALIGEFKEPLKLPCPDCAELGNDENCIDCGGSGSMTAQVTVSWTTIKAIHKRITKLFGNQNLEDLKKNRQQNASNG